MTTARSMQPSKVIECHAELVNRLATNEKFTWLLDYIVKDQVKNNGTGPFHNSDAEQAAIEARGMFTTALRAADAYHVSADMTKLVIAAARALEDEDLFDPTLAPTGCGIVRFDGGLPAVDIGGAELRVDWLIWGPGRIRHPGETEEQARPATIMWEFNDFLDNPDAISKMVEKEGRIAGIKATDIHGRWGFHGIGFARTGEPLGPQDVPAAAIDPGLVVSRAVAGQETADPTNVQRYLQALWMLLGQKVTAVSTRPPGHPSITAAAKRAKIPRRVTVVELRRREYVSDRDAAPSGRTYDHRWLVRGHWTNQAYGEGRAKRKRIWIDGYVKGPEGKPLLVRDQVNALRR